MILNEINKIIENKITGRHTFFQLQYFLIENMETHQAKLHQCIVELNSRKKTLENVELEILETKDKRELLKLEQKNQKCNSGEEQDIKNRMTERRIQHLSNRIQELNDSKKSAEEEAEFLIQTYKVLITEHEQLDWDSPEVQREYWNAKLLRELRMKAILGNRIDTEIMKTILALPDDTPVKKEMVGILHKSNNLEQSLNINTNDR